jgi:phage tail sheath protein FI
MPETFLHGVELIELNDGPRPIASVRSAVIGICGTAPNSQAVVQALLKTGVAASNNGLTFTAVGIGSLGNDVTVTLMDPLANSQTLSVVVTDKNIVVNLATSNVAAITSTAAAILAAVNANTAAAALVIVSATGSSTGAAVVTAVARTALSGGIDEAFPLNTPVLIAGSRVNAALLGSVGTLPQALDDILDQTGALVVVVRVLQGVDVPATTTSVIGGVNTGTGKYEGVHAFLGAESALGVAPRILIAPGFTHQRTGSTANPVVAELLGIAERLRAVIIADAPSTTDAAAITYVGDWGSKRVFVHDPFDTKLDSLGNTINVPASARIAGQICKQDNENGFWWSPSNQEVNGIIGTQRAIDFQLSDPNSRSNLLNAANVATTIRQNGYRLWGNRTCSADPKWAFLSVVRTADIINDSLVRAHLWAVDRNITKTYVQDVIEGVNDYLRHLVKIGAILGGTCWADPDLNTPDQIAQGKVYFDFDFTPPYPAEHITFRSHMVDNYLKEIF